MAAWTGEGGVLFLLPGLDAARNLRSGAGTVKEGQGDGVPHEPHVLLMGAVKNPLGEA